MRKDGNDHIKADEKAGEFGEDERKRLEAEVQKLTDDKVGQVDKMVEAKEQEIMKT